MEIILDNLNGKQSFSFECFKNITILIIMTKLTQMEVIFNHN